MKDAFSKQIVVSEAISKAGKTCWMLYKGKWKVLL